MRRISVIFCSTACTIITYPYVLVASGRGMTMLMEHCFNHNDIDVQWICQIELVKR